MTDQLKKWLPVFDTFDPKQLFTINEREQLAQFAEDFSWNITNININSDINFNPTGILPAFFKIINELKQNNNSTFKYNSESITNSKTETVKVGSFNNKIYNFYDENVYYDSMVLNLEMLYIYNDVNILNMKLLYISEPKTNNTVPTLYFDCNLTPIPSITNNQVNFQECAHLEIEDIFATSENTLADLYNLQKDIQENVYGYDFSKLQAGPLPELRQFFDWNYHAIQDELRETFAALGGMSDGIANGVWKPWKKAYHEQAPNMSLNDMSERDLKELKMELIDIQHFLFNMMLAVGMTPEELMNFYFAKNAENRRRQSTGTY